MPPHRRVRCESGRRAACWPAAVRQAEPHEVSAPFFRWTAGNRDATRTCLFFPSPAKHPDVRAGRAPSLGLRPACSLGGDEGARTLDPRLANVPRWLRVGWLSVQDMPSDLLKGRRAFPRHSKPLWPLMARSDDKMLTRPRVKDLPPAALPGASCLRTGNPLPQDPMPLRSLRSLFRAALGHGQGQVPEHHDGTRVTTDACGCTLMLLLRGMQIESANDWGTLGGWNRVHCHGPFGKTASSTSVSVTP